MMDVLIFLALIPLALAGFFILAGITWALLPLLVSICGFTIAYITSQDPSTNKVALVSGIFGVIGLTWMYSRFKDR